MAIADDFGLSSDDELFKEIYRYILKQLAVEVTGVLVEPELGLETWLDLRLGQTKPEIEEPPGLGMILTQLTGDASPTMVPHTRSDFPVHNVAQNYGAAYVPLMYHPQEEHALQKKQLLGELYDSCQHQGIELLVNVMVYTPAGKEFDTTEFQADQLQAVQELQAWADGLILQYPQDVLACATLTAELDKPWIVGAGTASYDQIKEVVRDSLEAGAAGAILSPQIWQEATQLRQEDHSPDMDEIKQFMLTTARDRLIELTRIVTEYTENSKKSP